MAFLSRILILLAILFYEQFTVTYMLFICLSFIYCLLVSDDPIIDSQQVFYISLNIFLERITNQ